MTGPDHDLLRETRRIHHQMPRWVLILLAAGILLATAYHTADLIVLLLVSGIIAYLFSSVISRIEYLGIRRSVAVTGLYACGGIILLLADLLLLPYLRQELQTFTLRMPEIGRQAAVSLQGLRDMPLAGAAAERLIGLMAEPEHFLEKMLNLSDVFSQAASFAFALVLVPFFTFFILKDWPLLLKAAMRLLRPAYVETAVASLAEINILAGKYLRGLAIDCFAVGVIASLGLWMLGVNYPVLLGIMTGAANVVPYFGPLASCAAAALIAFIQFGNATAVINVLLLYTLVKVLDDVAIQPLTIGRSVQLHPMVLVITIIAGQKVFGIMGMVLAVPAVTILQKVATILLDHRRRNAPGRPSAAYAGKVVV